MEGYFKLKETKASERLAELNVKSELHYDAFNLVHISYHICVAQ